MALLEGRFFTGSITDKRHEADGIAEYFRRFLTSGIWERGNDLLVTASSGLSVTVNYGAALIAGYLFRIRDNNAGLLTITTIPAESTRIDRIVIYKGTDNVGIKILHGGTSPPDLIRTESEYQISLAKITVDATGITNIEDERFSSSFCGLVSVKGAGLDSMPVGFSMPWWSDTLPSDKWLFGEGQDITAYPEAAAVYGNTLPDTRGRTLVGKSVSGTFSVLKGTTGAETTTEVPAHAHSIGHDHGSVNTGTESADHSHYTSGSTSSGGGHQHTACTGSYKVGSGSGSTYNYFTNNGTSGGQGTQGSDGTHSHTFGAQSGGRSAAHTHSVDLPAYTGNSGSAGSASVSIVQPSVICRWIFKIL